MNSLELATVAACNRMALGYGLTMQAVVKHHKAKPKYCLLYEGKELICNDDLQGMRKFCQNSSNLLSLSELQGINLDTLPITIGKFWDTLSSQVIRLRHLPEDIRIDISGCSNLYTNINKGDIHVTDSKIWVELTRRHNLTLFDKVDYVEADLIAVGVSATDLAKKEIASCITVSRLLTLADVLEVPL